MSRLPNIGGDDNQWGIILNDFLTIAHEAGGTLKDASVTNAKLDVPTQTSLGKADTALQSATKADVGLGNVDNTSDSGKPISTATQTALNAKMDSGIAGLPAGSTVSVYWSGSAWPSRPTARTDITVQWTGGTTGSPPTAGVSGVDIWIKVTV